MTHAARRARIFRVALFLFAPAVPVVLLGLALSHQIEAWTTERATTQAAESARLVADMAISPVLEPGDFRGTAVDPARRQALDALLQQFVGDDIVRIKIWDSDGRVVYSDDDATIGAVFPVSHELEDALRGDVSSEVSELDGSENVGEQDFDRLLEVYVPLRAGGDEPVVGAFELYLPYAPIDEAISRDTQRVVVILAAALALLYLSLARVFVDWERSRRRADDKEHEANHDALTGLPNRRCFRAELDRIAEAGGEGLVAVMYIDLDDFKTVNDTLGHAAGDQLLAAVAGRLRGAVRSGAMVARLGGDEFAIVDGAIGTAHEAEAVAARLIDGLRPPIHIGPDEVGVRASIGIEVTAARTLDPERVQRHADNAMYMAKGAGKCRHATFDAALNRQLHERLDNRRAGT